MLIGVPAETTVGQNPVAVATQTVKRNRPQATPSLCRPVLEAPFTEPL
jgi:hypothetical protein